MTRDFWMTQKEKEYLSNIVKSWIKNRNKFVKKKGFEPLCIKDQFIAYKILIDKNLVEILKSINNKQNEEHFLIHTGYNSKVEVRSFENY